jgi:uncharacterized membrane protein HdeD (DUF308 family)
MASPLPSQHGHLRPTLNSDGQSHKLLNVSTIATLFLGLASFILGLLLRNDPSVNGVAWAAIAAVTGLVSMVGGLFTQMVSTTTEQRILIVTGIIAGFIGCALGLAHGGFG